MVFSKILSVVVALGLIYFHIFANQPISSAIGFAILGYQVVIYLIPRLGSSFINIGLKGNDLSKPNRPLLPECMGAISAVVYLFTMFFFIPFIFIPIMVVNTSGGGNRDYEISNYNQQSNALFPHSKLIQYLSAVLCLESQILLGIADDLFDVKWRHKFFMPAIASIPLLIVYYIDFGVTSILVPSVIAKYLNQTTVDLGVFYYGYMAAIAIFCPNSINILAGVNGLEVGQSVVLALIFLINDFCYIFFSRFPSSISSHLFSVCLLIPFLGVSLGLLKFNWYPARVFVGDTYCYFAGMVFAVVGILGHFSKTLLLFFVPQIFNFIYSVPQLFHIVPCPRHRLPRFEEKSGLMYPSMAVLFADEGDETSGKFKSPKLKLLDPKGQLIQTILKSLSKLKLLKVVEVESVISSDDGSTKKVTLIKEINNLTLINLVLVIFGPLREDKLCITILGIQFSIGLLAIVCRHSIGHFLFENDNLWK
ncbi:UDP-N-acetylglucosamine--dolichyl-phosphate N-acetylglucosaminephosphotransferase [Saccharomycopsis crataegensis]|uniref:UDP-N-acetylglucosamine--dolichyl-phosphate N-acetylglucosaminephosphotransferase n=1 Tax=Saccharomycopsis crataegensis TaxID=43959 RepID=A0AAV5QGW5_9ASCO|nr:UDP-N-acetylglucosamine--dolichyl-phosphate N-acetylglucosaminephosphotransferase [Saccharomycopsis crataegensis]